MREEKGVASKLLVHLKSVLDAMVRDVEKAKTSTISGLAKTQTLPTRPSLSVAEQHRTTGNFNSLRQKSDQVTTKIFNDVVRTKEQRPNTLMETARLSKFYQEGERQQIEVEEAIANRRTGLSNEVIDRRIDTVNQFNSIREAKAVRTAAEYATHFEILQSRKDAERREIEIELAVEEKQRVTQAERDYLDGQEALSGIDAFERNLSRRGGSVSGSDKSVIDISKRVTTGVDPASHLQNMRSTLPDMRVLRMEGENTIKRIKSNRQEELATRAERERRRRKLASDREMAGETAEARRREDELLETLAVKSKQEQRVAERLRTVERERDVMRVNRKERDTRYEQQRQLDWEAALRREAKVAAQRRAQYRADAAAAAADIDDLLTQSEIERREVVRQFAKGTVSDILALAMRCAEYREVTDKLVPRREYREWSSLLLTGDPLPFALPKEETEVLEGKESITGGNTITTKLDELNAMDYLVGKGDWALASLGNKLTPHDGGLGLVDAPAVVESPVEEEAEENTTEEPSTEEPEGDKAEEETDPDAAEQPETADDEPVEQQDLTGRYTLNKHLGTCVFDVTIATMLERKPGRQLPESKFDARLAVVGPPFVGKTTAARRVAKERALVLIQPHELVREAVTEAMEWRDAERAREEAEEAAAAEKSAEASAAAGWEGEAVEEPCADAVPAAPESNETTEETEGMETTPEPEPVPEKPKASRKVSLGLLALDAQEQDIETPASVVAEIIAIAVDALAPPKPPPVEYPAPISDDNITEKEEEETDASPDPDPPGEEATDKEKVEYEELLSKKAKEKADKLQKRREELKLKRQEEIETLEAAYQAQLLELENTYPRPPGYVIDGFPNTAEEAAALEFAFTGLDPTKGERIKNAVSKVATPTDSEIAAKSNVEYKSGLDGVIVLELPCYPDCQAATLRALGRRIDPETKVTYHLDYDPPPEDEPGLAERLRLIEPIEESKVEERLHHWNLGGHVKKMRDWLDLFGQEQPGSLRVPIDATLPTGEVFELVDQEVVRVLNAKAAARTVLVAADAAAVAAANAQKAAEAVAIAGEAMEKAAQQLLHLRKAEIEAKALVAEAGEGGEGGEEGEGEAPPTEGDAPDVEAKATPKPTAAASALLAQKASEAVAEELVKARACAAEAAQHAADAEQAWEQAKQAVEDARLACGDAEATESARVASEAALERAVAAGDAASESLNAAKAASLAVDATVAKADAAVAAVDAEDVEAAEKLGAEGEEGGEEGEEGGEGAEEADDTPPVVLPTPTPDEKILPIPTPLAEAIAERWQSTETSYVDGLKSIFSSIREERALGVAHFAETKKTYGEFLNRPDGKMTLVREFQHAFNDIDLDHRRDPKTIGELLLRADELRDSLWDVCDEKLAEATAEREGILSDTWTEDHARIAVTHYCSLVQLELDKFCDTAPVFADYFAARRGEPLPVVEDANEGDKGDAAEKTEKVASWFTLPPPPPDVLGSVASGEAVQGEEQMLKPTPPPPVPSVDDEEVPEYVKVLVREIEENSGGGGGDAPAEPSGDAHAEGEQSATATSDDLPDLPVITGPPAPALAGAIAAALGYVKEVAPDEEGAEGDAEETPVEPADAEGENGEALDPETPKPKAPEETKAAMREERRVLEQRLERIADRCYTHVVELDRVARLCHKRLAEQLRQKYKSECGAVAALAEEVKVAAEDAVPLVNDLLIEVVEDGLVGMTQKTHTITGDVLVVQEEERNILPPPAAKPAPPMDSTPKNPGVFTGMQFFSLCRAFAECAPSGVITPAECASVMEALTVDTSGAYAQLQTSYVHSDSLKNMPPAFAAAGRRRLANVARLFKFGDSPYVEWRAMVMSVLGAMYPALLDAEPALIASAANQLKAPALSGKKAFAQSRKLWFLPAGDSFDHENDENDTDWSATMKGSLIFSRKDGQSLNPMGKQSGAGSGSGDVASAAVMRGLAEAFGEPGVDGAVDIKMLAMHLCISSSPEVGAGKAVAVAQILIDPEEVRLEQKKKEKEEKEAAELEARKEGAEGPDPAADPAEPEASSEPPSLPPMTAKERRAVWCTAAGPGAMSAEAVNLLKKKDLEGKDVDLPAMAFAASSGTSAPLLGIATQKWFAKYGWKDAYEVVQM